MMRIKDASFFRLKAAMADLIERCGSQKRAGELVGLAQQTISRICVRDDSMMLSLEAKLRLELECGAPLVTQVEAELLGYRMERLAPLAAPPSEGTAFSAHAAVMIEVGDLARDFALSVGDGVYSRADAVTCGKALADLKHKIEAFERVNAATMAGGAA